LQLPLHWPQQCSATGKLEEEPHNKLIQKNSSNEIQITSDLIITTLHSYSIQHSNAILQAQFGSIGN